MDKKALIPSMMLLFSLAGCVAPTPREYLISLYSDSSRYYVEDLSEEHSAPLKTYRHKNYGEVPFVSLEEYCGIFPKTSLNSPRHFAISEGKAIISDGDKAAYVFDAKEDKVITTPDVDRFFLQGRRSNNGYPFEIYFPKDSTSFIKESPKTKRLAAGKERTYDCKKYSFDIVYEKGVYYAPFSLLHSLFFEFGTEAAIYNGRDFFDADYLEGESPTVQYCYSSKGSFLLDLSGGKLGPALFEPKAPVGEEEYHFETTIAASGQKIVFTLSHGTGFIKSYSHDGSLIEEDSFKKVQYERKGDILILKYFTVFEEQDGIDKAISDIYTLNVHMDETFFHKETRSKAIADFSYQELRFAMYELYGKTRNVAVKDFDTFIKDKEYKDGLLSLDAKAYDEALAKFLLLGIDDGHTSLETTSIYGVPTMANANHYSSLHEGARYGSITSGSSQLRQARKEAGLGQGLNIVNKTAVLSFDKFLRTQSTGKAPSLKAYSAYAGTDPKTYVEDDTMEYFASCFNAIEANKNVENVVIDLTCNTGGKTATLAYLLSFLTADPTITVNHLLADTLTEHHYLVDLDQDGVYGSDKDTFQGKYRFYVLTSPSSFSCGNHFPTICKELGIATILGERSAGGSCVISTIANASGTIYHSSSEHVAVRKEGDHYVDNDSGIPVDRAVERSYWYDHAKLDALLSTFKS